MLMLMLMLVLMVLMFSTALVARYSMGRACPGALLCAESFRLLCPVLLRKYTRLYSDISAPGMSYGRADYKHKCNLTILHGDSVWWA